MPSSMRFSRLQKKALATAAVLLFVLVTGYFGTSGARLASAQSLISGDITGVVLDPNGAGVLHATVKAANEETGGAAAMSTTAIGGYRFSLLKPGVYHLTVSAPGFKTGAATVKVAVGEIVTQNFRLALGAASETVEVKAAGQLLQTDTAELSTEVGRAEIETLPNPGSDISYLAQAKPGVVMNTGANSSTGSLGYGNFSAFGLPGASNEFTIDGMPVNDPFFNLNNSGPSNLTLGLNDIAEANIISNAYEVQYGTLGGAQVDMITRSGTDHFHGNVNYAWNGRAMNANDWFNKSPLYNATPLGRPFSNFNQWAGAVGGPIVPGKAFFFFSTEGIAFATSSQNVIHLPSAAFESSVVGPDGACDDSSSSLYAAGQGSQCAFYTTIFKLYNGAPGYARAVPSSTPGQLQLSEPTEFSMSEKQITARYDQILGPSDKAFVHYTYDHGVQPTYTDPINAAFDAESNQPIDEGQLAETHTFGARAVNQFNMSGMWYSFIFVNKNPAAELAAFPFMLYWYDGFATNLNNDAIEWPNGRDATQIQFADDFSESIGRHTLKAGVAFRKDFISDHDPGVYAVPLVGSDVAYGDFTSGQSIFGVQHFPTSLDLPLSLYTLGLYVQDDWKPMPNLTLTAGVRLERNSNISCSTNCLSNFGGSFFTEAASAPLNSLSGAYNKQIQYGLSNAFPQYQAAQFEPRAGFAWTPLAGGKTVLRGGAGVFADLIPSYIADSMLNNPPLTTAFTIYGATFGGPFMPLDPSAPGSFQSQAASANATFVSGFKAGGSAASMTAANPNFSVPSFTTVEGHLHYPRYLEYNLQIQRQIGRFESIQIGYVGNHGYHEPGQNVGVNAYVATGAAYGLPGKAPAPSFSDVNEIGSDGRSSYNGLVASWLYRGHGLNAQLNYTFSHALDEISNGGMLPFNAASIYSQIDPYDLRKNYGNADYDVRHYFSGTYLYQMPYFGGPRRLTAGWQAGGTVFWNSGSPFTPSIHASDFGEIENYGSPASVVPLAYSASARRHCGASAATKGCFNLPSLPATAAPGATMTSPDFPTVVWTNTAASASAPASWTVGPTSSATLFGAAERNQFYGPHYFDTDLTLLKSFDLARRGDQRKLEIGMTAFNLFNHPNFGEPNAVIDNGVSQFGWSLYAEGPPTTIYGSGLGGDPSIRTIELNGRVVF